MTNFLGLRRSLSWAPPFFWCMGIASTPRGTCRAALLKILVSLYLGMVGLFVSCLPVVRTITTFWYSHCLGDNVLVIPLCVV